MEGVGERPVQVLGELKRRGQAIDEEVLGVRRDDAVRLQRARRNIRCSGCLGQGDAVMDMRTQGLEPA